MAPIGFLVWGRPPTANKVLRPEGRRFLDALRADHAAQGQPWFDGLLFGSITWFVMGYRPRHHPDADNISKKVWDRWDQEGGIGGLAYADDEQVRLRTAAIIDLAPPVAEARILEPPRLPVRAADALDRLIAGGDAVAHGFAYIELGPFEPDMLRFAMLGSGDAP